MPTKSKLIIFVAVMASLLEIIDTSIVNVALPTIMGNLGVTLDEISMIITGYAIANAIVLPVSAWLSERVGRRKYFLGCILAFTTSSVACGFSPNLTTLTIMRIVQGLMGGALLPTSQALIYEQFPKEKAGFAGAIFGMSVMIGPALGPVMGGYLTDEFGWRSIFNVNLPLGLVAFFVGLLCIFDREKSESEKATESRGFDSVGLALLVLGIGFLQFVLERGEALDWFSSKAIILGTLITVVSLPAFVWWELRVKNPIINVRLFKEAIVTCGVGLMGCLGFFLYGALFILPVFLGRTFHYSATQTGIFFIPGSILTALMMPFIGKAMTSGRNPKFLILIGLVSIEICMYLMTLFSPQSSKSEILAMLFVRGLALAFLFVPINSSILSQFSGAALGQVSGLLNLFRQIGGSMGVAFVGTMLVKTSAQNYLDLSTHVSLLNDPTKTIYYSTAKGLGQKLSEQVGDGTGIDATLKILYAKVQGQVFMMSFIQLVWMMMIIFALSFIPLYFLKLKVKPSGPIDSH
ncbi:MAG: DHA2 family efflux MFS transporter permease subunit [Pseudobdellovibrio sp.]